MDGVITRVPCISIGITPYTVRGHAEYSDFPVTFTGHWYHVSIGMARRVGRLMLHHGLWWLIAVVAQSDN